jgi:hypothetical protein
MLPPAHVHAAGIEGRSRAVVHRHTLAKDASGPLQAAVTSHGDHERAQFLDAVYDRTVRFAQVLPAVAMAAVTVAPPADPVGRIRAVDARRVHGPPGRTRPARAPPSRS